MINWLKKLWQGFLTKHYNEDIDRVETKKLRDYQKRER